MSTRNLLYKRECVINDNIHIVIPTVGEILEQEDIYYSMVAMLTAMPIDMMVQLDDVGIDFTTINEYELFLLLFETLKQIDTSLIFGELDLRKFEKAVNMQNEQLVLINRETGVRIDRAIQVQIADTLRKIHHLEKNLRKPANKEAQDYLIERARKKLQRERKRMNESQLEGLIVALVNTSEFGYGYEGVRDLSIYQFNQSLRQVAHKINYDNRMHGVYSGTVNVKELSHDDLTWLIQK